MSYVRKPFEELNILDDFFATMLAHDAEVGETFCRNLVQGLLQKPLGNIRVSVQSIIPANTPEQRGIRMDIEIMEGEEVETANGVEWITKEIYDIEPHKQKNGNLPKHNRFYQAKIDAQNLKAGENNFVKLPNLYVITITDYDPFGYDYMMYTIHNKCDEISKMEYTDGLNFIYFYTNGTKGGNSSIKKLLNYIKESKIDNVTDDITKAIHDCVSRVKTLPEARMEYMVLGEWLFYERQEAKNEGIEEGRAEGREEGRNEVFTEARTALIEAIKDLIEDYGEIPECVAEKLDSEKDLGQLRRWLKLAAKADSMEEFEEKMELVES